MIEHLYHGTSDAVLDKIMTEGIRPRSLTGMTNWKMSVESGRDRVYLSRAFAPYFAMVAADSYGGNPVVLEIATVALDPELLLPDEDALEQGSRKLGATELLHCPQSGMVDRTLYFRRNARRLSRQMPNLWLRSLQVLGNCCYRGTVPPEAIVASRVFESTASVILDWGDPTISVLAYAILGGRYRVMTDKMFGRMSALEDLRDYNNHNRIIEELRKAHDTRRVRTKA